jgi:O-antigen/teichoic acid export membrane protein
VTGTSDFSKIAKNTIFLNAATVVTRGLSFITSMVIARYLGESGFGRYTFALCFSGMFVILTDLGLSYLTVREVARDKSIAGKYLGHNLVIRTVFGIITFALIFIAVTMMDYPHEVETAVHILAFFTIMKCVGSSFGAIFMAFERMGLVALLDVIISALILGGILAGIYLEYDLINLIRIYPAAVIVYICLSFILVVRTCARPEYAFDFSFAWNLIRKSFPFALSSIFVIIMSNIDTVMLKTMKGDIPAGYYGVTRALISVLVFIPANFTTVLYPVFSRYYQSSMDSLIKYYEQSFRLFLVMALPIAAGGMIVANGIIVLFYGQSYSPATPSLQIMVWALAIQFLSAVPGILMLAVNRQKTITLLSFAAVVLNIVLNVILIPRYSFVGASIATLAAYSLIFILILYIISRDIHRLEIWKVIWKPLLAALLMGVFAFCIREANVFLVIALSASFYLAALSGLGEIRRSDIDLLRRLIKPAINPE